MKISRFLANQAKKPSGPFGRYIGIKIINTANKRLKEFAIDQLELKGDETILEIGFGSGMLISMMYQQLTSGKIFGAEISKDMIQLATRRNQQGIESGDISLFPGNVRELPFKEATMDVVISLNTIYFWDDTQGGLAEIMKVLKDNGKFYCGWRIREEVENKKVVKNSRDVFRLFTESELEAEFHQAGFANVEIASRVDKPFDSYIISGQKIP